MNRHLQEGHWKPGDRLRYDAGGRPDAVVAQLEPGGAQVRYASPWRHPGLNRDVTGQFISYDEQGEWRSA